MRYSSLIRNISILAYAILAQGRSMAVLVETSGEGTAVQLNRRVYDPSAPVRGDIAGAIPMLIATTTTSLGTTITQIRGALDSPTTDSANGKLQFGVVANGTLRDGAELTSSGLNILASGNLNIPGSVGVGTTNGMVTPGYKLDVNGTARANAFVGDGSGLTGIDASWGVASGLLSTGRGGTGKSSLTTGSLLFGGNTIGFDATNLFWDNTNKKLGIGTGSMNSRLDIRGPRWTGTTGFQAVEVLYSTDTLGAGVGAGLILGGKYTSTSVAEFGQIAGVKENATNNNNAGALTLSTRAYGSSMNERMRIDSSGHVGIGRTDPSAPLDVLSNYGMAACFGGLSEESSGYIQFNGFEDTNLKTGLIFEEGLGMFSYTEANSSVGYKIRTDGSDRLTVLSSSGNMGIGTSSPANKLDVAGETNISSGRKLRFANASSNLSSFTSQDGVFWSNSDDDSNFGLFKTAGSWSSPNYQQLEMLSFTGLILDPGSSYGKSYVDIKGNGLRVTSGDAGIGTTAPNERLDVRGNVSIDGDDSTGKGIVMDAAKRPLISRGLNAFTSGGYSGLGRWGLTMEDFNELSSPTLGSLTVMLPNSDTTPTLWAHSGMFAIKAFNADSSIKRNIAMFTNDYGVGIGDFGESSYPYQPFAVKRSTTGPIANFWNPKIDYNSWGVEIRCGETTGSLLAGHDHQYLRMMSNNGNVMAVLMGKASHTDIYYLSDERLKKDLAPTIVDEQQVLNNINVIDYNMNDSGDNRESNARITGFSAQNLEAAYPTAVAHFSAADNGTTFTHGLSDLAMVAPTALIPLLVKSSQTHAATISDVQNQTDALAEQVALQSEALGLNNPPGGQGLRASTTKTSPAPTSDSLAALLPNFANAQTLEKMLAHPPQELSEQALQGKRLSAQFTGPDESALDPASLPIEVTNYLKLLGEWENNTNPDWVIANKQTYAKGAQRNKSLAEAQTYIAHYKATHRHPSTMKPEELGLSVERLSTWNYQAIYDLLQRLQAVEQKLSGEKKVAFAKLKVPDYVFEPGYDRMSLSELRNYLKHNRHMPGVPSRSEIEKYGIENGQMLMKVLEKVEELALYAIDQESEYEQTAQQLTDQQKRIVELEKANGELRAQFISVEDQLKAMQAQIQLIHKQ